MFEPVELNVKNDNICIASENKRENDNWHDGADRRWLQKLALMSST